MGVSGDRLGAPEPIRGKHDTSSFDSGEPALNDWLRRRALANEVSGASRTLVCAAGPLVAGYYSLAAGSVFHGEATSRARRNMPEPIPAVLLARLAVDRRWQGRGLGGDLLRDASLRVVAAADVIGVRVLLVHALTDAAKVFYERFGFKASPVAPLTLMLTLDEMRRAIAEAHR
jgi:GNAT superfamily N-acetyltransferase